MVGMVIFVFDTQHANNIPTDSPEHGDHHRAVSTDSSTVFNLSVFSLSEPGRGANNYPIPVRAE